MAKEGDDLPLPEGGVRVSLVEQEDDDEGLTLSPSLFALYSPSLTPADPGDGARDGRGDGDDDWKRRPPPPPPWWPP